jgi:hypothetical protein
MDLAVNNENDDKNVHEKNWETISAERAEECLREAMRRGSKPLNTSRLNIVGEGRAGKTALLRAVSNKAFEDTTSTIGVKQSLLEVNKVDLETKCGGGWSVVEEGTLIMKAEEAMTRLAAEIAITQSQVYPMQPKDEKNFLKKVTKILGKYSSRVCENFGKTNKVLTEEERKALLEVMHKYSQELSNTGTNRFGVGVKDMVTGEYEGATDGLNALLGLKDDDHLLANAEEIDIEGMEKEIHALNSKKASEHIDYVVRQRASEKRYAWGIRDRGHVGKTLEDFVNDPVAKKAKLNKADVAALRIWGILAEYIDGPLRNSEGKPHPLPITVLLLSRALKKLKRVGGGEDSGSAEMVVWRGIKNLRTTDEFITEGGKWIISHAPCEQVVSFSILNINFRCSNGACANVDNRQFGSGIEILTKCRNPAFQDQIEKRPPAR